MGKTRPEMTSAMGKKTGNLQGIFPFCRTNFNGSHNRRQHPRRGCQVRPCPAVPGAAPDECDAAADVEESAEGNFFGIFCKLVSNFIQKFFPLHIFEWRSPLLSFPN